jgi:hypothetical protein
MTIVGKIPFPVLISAPDGSPLDFRSVDPRDCHYEQVVVEPKLLAACLNFLDHFGLLFGAFDFAVDGEGRPWFLECNPAGQWGWLEDFTDIPITSTLVDLLLSLR